ncbi:hypothetical protein R1flu_021027 [Riccia fluitans]|uniref:BTB domain-containing protein n=1 Tax=Riccia fluitans TaxID=41844 RepID=A0ABD1ZRL6_9MARC
MPVCNHCSQIVSCKTCNEHRQPIFSVPRERIQEIDACSDCAHHLKRVLQERTKHVNNLKKTVMCLQEQLNFLRKLDPKPGSDKFRGDVTFVVENERLPNEFIQAHQFVLASKSPLFRSIFDPGMHEKLPATIHVYDTAAPVLRAMVNFCYTAEIAYNNDVTPERALRISHKYDIPELKCHAETVLIQGINQDNLVQTMRIAHKHDSPVLKDAAIAYFETHFADVKNFVIDSLVR